MLDGISDIASGVRSCNPGGLEYHLLMEELRARCSPLRQSELLERHSQDQNNRPDIKRAVKLLRKAAIASQMGNRNRTFAMVRLALQAVGRNKQIIRDLLVTHELSFSIIPRPKVARDRHGLVDPRLTEISERRPRYGFAV